MSPEMIDAMIAAGLTREQMAALLKHELAKQESAKADKRAKDAARKRKQRHAESRDVTRTECDMPGHGVTEAGPYTEDAPTYAEPEPNITTTPPTSEAEASSVGAPEVVFGEVLPFEPLPIAKPNPRGTRLPANWWPPPECEAWCRSEFRLTDHQLSEAVDEFRDFWHGVPGERGRKCDWPATFRNACRKRFGQARRASSGGHGSQGGGRLAAYQRAAAHFSPPNDVP